MAPMTATALRAVLNAALVASGVFMAVFAVMVERRRPRREDLPLRPRPLELAVGFITDFFDTLGIGSFAPTTAMFRAWRLVPDQLIPGTLMVGHAIPSIAEALIYIGLITVDTVTLVLLIAASVLGSVLGAGFVARLPRRSVQLGMGGALLAASLVMLAGLVGVMPPGGDLIALTGVKLIIGLVGNFVLGALMTIGIGAYAPSLILFGLLGMNLKAVFPIMMGSCALLMPTGGARFVRPGAYSPRVALALTLGGVPGVLLAAFVVRELPLLALRWLVLAVVVYTALSMLRSGLKQPVSAEPERETTKGNP
jgi:uncharacterized membrane protein YfcA